MTTRRRTRPGQDQPEPTPTPTPTPEPGTPDTGDGPTTSNPEPEPARPYTVTDWRGLPLYNCRACRWNTLAGEATFLEHWEKAHQPRGRKSAIVDRFGNPIELPD